MRTDSIRPGTDTHMPASVRDMLGFMPPARDLGHSDVVHDSWREHFRALPAGARLLDIASGIGALSLLAQEISRERGRGFELHSLDQASTLNAPPLMLDGISFHARRYDQTTCFDAGYFDAVSGQWLAPEEDTAASGLTELRRILKPGGRARFLFHAVGGAAYEQYQGRIRAVDMLLDEFQLLVHARRMFEVAFTQETALRRDPVQAVMLAFSSLERYHQAVERMRLWNPGTPNPKAAEQVVQFIDGCWQRRQVMTLAEIGIQLDRLEERLRTAQMRMQAVCALAMDETRAHRLGRQFRAAGFEGVKVRALKLPSEDVILGWDLLAA
jgi:SAM-dependent methyltransferase